MASTSKDLTGRLLETFHVEAEAYHTVITRSVQALNQASPLEDQQPHLVAAFHATHSLKGAATAVHQADVEALCHALEGIFSNLQEVPVRLSSPTLTTFQRTLDAIDTILKAPEGRYASLVADAMDALMRVEEEVDQLLAEQTVPATDPWQIDSRPSDEEIAPPSSPPPLPSEALATEGPQQSGQAEESAQHPPKPRPSPALPADLHEQLRAMFRVEAEEHYTTIVNGLLELEKITAPDAQAPLIEKIFRAAHSLKGAARTVSLTDIEQVCQALEDVFARLKRQDLQLSQTGFDTLHQALDTVDTLLGSSREGKPPLVLDTAETITALSQLGEEDRAPVTPTGDPRSASTFSETPPEIHPKTENTPGNSAADSEESVGSRTGPQRVPEKYSPAPPSQASPPPPASPSPTPAETIRVSTAKLDGLLLQAEEMLAAKQAVGERMVALREVLSTLNQWHKEWAKLSPEARKFQRIYEASTDQDRRNQPYLALATKLVDFLYWNEQALGQIDSQLKALMRAAERDHQEMSRMVDSLLDDTKKVLMLPFSSIVDSFPKMVRDVSRTLGKEVVFTIQGGEVEIDKRMLEELKDPLIHLLRNSIDHGIESPDVRRQQHKPAEGSLLLSISQVSASTAEVVIADDGAGIDRTAVKRAAVKLGLLTAPEVETLDDQATLSLIFQSAVTTSSMVTDLSGRGLGMAIVREKIEKLGGQISIETTPGQGTLFRISLPLTLATFRGIFIQAAGQTFVIPTANVERIVRARPDEVKTIEHTATVMVQDRPVGLTRLDTVLGLPPKRQTKRQERDVILALVLGAADKRLAFCVDAVLNEQEVLFKSLGSYLTTPRYVAGATVLSSGTVVPILYAPDLLRSVGEGAASASSRDSNSPADESQAPRSVLLAEDSVTSRMLLKGILESAGYHVTTAIDGQDAFDTLQRKPFDLLVSDVEMPRLNGFELTTQIRASGPYTDLPVVLVTGLDSPADRERGIQAGANAYLVKGNFDHGNLLEVVQQLM